MLPSAWGGGGAPRDDGDNTVRVWWVLGTQSCLLQPDGRTAALPPGSDPEYCRFYGRQTAPPRTSWGPRYHVQVPALKGSGDVTLPLLFHLC